GELCVLPTETVYGLAMLPSHAGAVAKARALKGRGEQQPFTWHIAARADLDRLVGNVPRHTERLIDRYWPGPLTVILAVPGDGTAGVRLPAHDFTREVIATCGEPLWLSSVNANGETPLVDAVVIIERFGKRVRLVVDDGPSPLGLASTIVRQTGARLEVLREGILTTDEVLRTAADLCLFVCSGNTCRSPLAEALARDLTARTLGVARAEVLAHGLDFQSAGTSAMPGLPASEGSIEVAAELELDLDSHLSQPIDPELLRRASHVYCMSQSHLLTILAEVPGVGDRTEMLRLDGLDIADPYGADVRTYRRVRDEIRAAVGARVPTWLGTSKA
ncbi:MAG: Sua5/YciO/YrdC/YwlC family protein, partial [Planctomycetota bacterium]